MTGYYNNLALHITEATLKGQRRLTTEPARTHWGYLLSAGVGAAAAWLAAMGLLG